MKKDKRRSTEVSSNMIGKKSNMTDRRTKAKSTRITQTLETKGDIKTEKPKKLPKNKQPSATTSPVASPTLPIRSSGPLKTPNTEKDRVYPPAPAVNIPLKNLDDFLPDLWTNEKKCLLMLLETRVLFREILEFRIDSLKPKISGSAVELRKLIAIYPDDEEEDTDFIAEIAELRKQLILQIRANQQVERELAVSEKKSALLIMNRSSIAELDRNAKKKKKKVQDDVSLDNDKMLLNDPQKMSLYENLFYLLQTQPKYLAKLTRVIPLKNMDGFIETIIKTLFGDAFSPREEFLLLTLFKLSIHQEIQHLQNFTELTQVDSVVPKMIIAYNKRKQGKEYLIKTLAPPVTSVLDNMYNFDSPEDMEKALDSFLNCIIKSIDNIPYGFRLILKQITEFMRIKFSQITDENLMSIYGFYYYFKFLNPCMIDPSETGILNSSQIDMKEITNLAKISRILQFLFENRLFSGKEEKYNDWIKTKTQEVSDFFKMLIDVKPPEDELQVDRYTELYSKQQPIIIIQLKEITEIHELFEKFLGEVTTEPDDPINQIIKELGTVPQISMNSTTDVQLTLKNRFGSRFEQELSDLAELFDATKELIIRVFRVTPIDQSPSPNLLDILEYSQEYARQNSDKKLEKNASEAHKNLVTLEKSSFITSEDNYEAFLKTVSAELSNRALRREQQQKEILKLRTALRELQNHHTFVMERISDMEQYLESCRKKLASKLKNKTKPTKFTYSQLLKEGVIAESDVPEQIQSKTTFLISMPKMGTFQIEAKIFGAGNITMQLELEDLLEKKDNGDFKLELEKVTIYVTPTILLMNKHFLR